MAVVRKVARQERNTGGENVWEKVTDSLTVRVTLRCHLHIFAPAAIFRPHIIGSTHGCWPSNVNRVKQHFLIHDIQLLDGTPFKHTCLVRLAGTSLSSSKTLSVGFPKDGRMILGCVCVFVPILLQHVQTMGCKLTS